MNMSSQWYYEQLQKPEWKAKRKEVWKRDGYNCKQCGRNGPNDKVAVCAHHIRYTKGKRPWECPLEDLITWCIECHNTFHQHTQVNAKSLLDAQTIELLEQAGLNADPWEQAIAAELENILLQIYLEDRDERLSDLLSKGAQWDAEGQYFGLNDKFYDADGELM